jgi:hypothetical protein
MPEGEPKKIAYLFGAGATHAELHNLDQDLVEQKALGLLIGDVSKRVIEKARCSEEYIKGIELVSGTSGMVSGTSGSFNIELLISLIESSKVNGWEYKTSCLKQLVQKDIETVLSKFDTNRFCLHRGLFELHKHRAMGSQEELIGLISLNYEDVLDQAYKESYGVPDYCLSLADRPPSESIPLLKLHGSFGWKKGVKVRGRRRIIEIIPMGAAKSYLHAPYGFIWNRALEVLIRCDILRVVGCSLSPNDSHLIDALFKAHLERNKAFDLEIINSTKAGEDIKRNYAFFRGIKLLTDAENSVPEPNPANPFREWLKYRSIRILGESTIRRTKHLRKL